MRGLNLIVSALDERGASKGAPIDIFVRDDDAGWGHDSLVSLMDVTMQAGVPMDLAAIPEALDAVTVAEIASRMASAPALVGVHQHGFAHANHETEGRRCEFGASRPAALQLEDLRRGRELLADAFGDGFDAIFTPPWNRCTGDTVEQLTALGYTALSRDRRSARADSSMPELPVDVDWSRAWREDGEDRVAEVLSSALRAQPAGASALGLMLHHDAMGHDERRCLQRWLQELARHPRLRWRLMRDCVVESATAAAGTHRSTRNLATRFVLSTALTVAASFASVTDASAQVEVPSAPDAPAPPPQGLREDERRSDQPLIVPIGPLPFELTGGWEFTDQERKNFDTDTSRARDRRVREHELKLEARTRVTPTTEVLLQIKGLHETRRTQGTAGRDVEEAIERGQAWVRFSRLGGSPWSLQFGRIAMTDRRSWWWDDDLDAVRAQYIGDSFLLDTAVARELAPSSSAQSSLPGDVRGITRGMVQASWLPARRHRLDAFFYDERDRSGTPSNASIVDNEDRTDPVDRNARWFGVRAIGEWRWDPTVRLAYWADTALLRGRERTTEYDEDDSGRFTAGATESARLRGQAYDVGLTLSAPDWPLRPFATLAKARGGTGFRQTGLQENKARRGGVKRWQSYGELLQPELSNLNVDTVGVGMRFLARSSFELHTYRYRQLRASSTLHGSRLSSDPQGTSPDIGRGVDVMLAVREWRRVDFFAVVSRFKPGAAFDAGERSRAQSIELGFQLAF
jgi:alginate production protein